MSESARMHRHPAPTDAELDRLIERARNHVMSPAERDEQRISWVAGELGIEHPDWSPEYCRRLAREACGATHNGGKNDGAPQD